MAQPSVVVPETPAAKWRRRLIRIFVVVVVVLAGAWSLDYYRVWRYRHLLDYAAAAAANKDWEGVQFSLRQAMVIQPGSIEPYERLADYSEELEPAEAVYWRRSVAQQEPAYVRHRINWVRAALRQGNFNEAAEALNTIEPANRGSAQVQALIAKVSAATGDVAAATKAAAEAVKLEPSNATNRFMLAKLQLVGTNQTEAAAARVQLEAATQRPGFGLEANRALGLDALQRNDLPLARAKLEAALTDPEAGLQDQIRFLDLLKLENSSELPARLSRVRSDAGTNVSSVLALSQWMTTRGLAGEAAQWIQGLPTNLTTHPLVRGSRLEAHLAAGQTEACSAWLQSENWDADDHLRLSLLARVSFGLGRTNEADAFWNEAVAKGRTTPRGRRALWQSASEARWTDKAMAVLQLAAEAPTDRRWALTVLFDHYSRLPDTTNMLKVSRQLLAVTPEDTLARNNVAALSLLLKENVDDGFALARQAWKERPQDPAVLATYGFGLFLKGKTTEALEIFERIPPQYAAHPSIAVYYGTVLLANGQGKKAQPYLKVASTGNILPEEREILESSLKQLTVMPQ